MRICIIGLGLLGGSFGLALREQKQHYEILGVDTNENHAKIALKKNLVDRVVTLKEGVSGADVVILATPVDTINSQLEQVLDLLPEGGVVTDFGSTKELICKTADNHAKRSRFVAGHPIAGTEDSGPGAAFAKLLKDKMMILCDTENSDPGAVETIKNIYKSLGMNIHFMSSGSHDLHIAFVSHLSHISSFALGASVLEKERDEKNIFIMAGSGFSSTVRLAKSSPDMWAPIFRQNKDNISKSLDLYIKKLSEFKRLLEENNYEELYHYMKETNDIRRILKGD